ncbi:MAG: S16 family serine protease [Candidatus Methanofastidiosia archaeon]
MKRIYIVWFILLLSLWTPLHAEDQHQATITAPAVERTPDGLRGVLSYITVVTQEGAGHVYIDTWPLAEVDIQGSARLAVQVACDVVHKDWEQYDFFITVRSDSPIIGGPSAGGAMTVAVIASLQGWELSSDVVMSGTINPDETVGPVGGLYQKAQAASEVAHTFLVPDGQTTIVVEEQTVQTQGPFTYVTTSQKQLDLVEEGKTMGLQVKEVYDIREAVYYFTGHEIETPQVEAEPIKADFMKPYAGQQVNTIEEEYKSVSDSVQEYTGSYKGDLQHVLESAQEQIIYAHTAYDSGNYYTSMSACYVAGLFITYAQNLLLYFENQSVEEIFSDLTAEIDTVFKETTEEHPHGMTALQCIATAQNRIFEAREYLKRAQGQQSTFNQVEYASYAERRKESAEFWLKLAQEYQEGSEISQDTLRNAASSMLNTAELSLVYASSILPASNLLNEAQSRLQTAQEQFVEEVYAASLFSAVESRVYSEVALISYAAQKEILAQKVERARERASKAIETSRQQGIEPVLAVSYYELTLSLDDPTQSLIYLGYAEEVASMAKYIETQPSIPVATREPVPSVTPGPGTESPVPETPESEPAQQEGGYTGALAILAAGIVLGVLGSWLVTRAVRK